MMLKKLELKREIFSHSERSLGQKEVCMDIAGLSGVMSTVNLQSQVGVAVISKAMDTNEALGQGLVEMIDAAAMEQSVNPQVGSNIDIRI